MHGYFDDVVQVGEKLDYDSNTANLCLGCLQKALELIKPNVKGKLQPARKQLATPKPATGGLSA
mgnify:CR=1 FL=1